MKAVRLAAVAAVVSFAILASAATSFAEEPKPAGESRPAEHKLFMKEFAGWVDGFIAKEPDMRQAMAEFLKAKSEAGPKKTFPLREVNAGRLLNYVESRTKAGVGVLGKRLAADLGLGEAELKAYRTAIYGLNVYLITLEAQVGTRMGVVVIENEKGVPDPETVRKRIQDAIAPYRDLDISAEDAKGPSFNKIAGL